MRSVVSAKTTKKGELAQRQGMHAALPKDPSSASTHVSGSQTTCSSSSDGFNTSLASVGIHMNACAYIWIQIPTYK